MARYNSSVPSHIARRGVDLQTALEMAEAAEATLDNLRHLRAPAKKGKYKKYGPGGSVQIGFHRG